MAYVGALPAAFEWPLLFCATTTAVTFVLSLITSNVSQVDRLWTFLPTIYTAYYALLPLWSHTRILFIIPFSPKAIGWAACKDYSPRTLLMLALVVIWMLRLSYNTYRRGLFNLRDEDYRWGVLRSQLPTWLFQLTNFFFISGIQNVILLLLGLPAYVSAVLQPHTPLTSTDYWIALAALSVLVLEFTADNQQYSFQTYKRAYISSKKDKSLNELYSSKDHWAGSRINWVPADAERGFVTRGLWAYSRHPNFLCEQVFWWLITLMPLVALPPSFPSRTSLPLLDDMWSQMPWSLLHFLYQFRYLSPAITLSALFFASTAYTEAITMSKYPLAYRAYQRRVAMFWPVGTLGKAVILIVKGEIVEVEQTVWGDAILEGKLR